MQIAVYRFIIITSHTDFKISKGYTVNFTHQRLVTAPLHKCL